MDWVEYMVGGTIGGVSGVIAGQPLDTIKVRMQTQAAFPELVPYRNAVHCAMTTIKEEGFAALYRGILAPVLTNLPLNAITFGVERVVFGAIQRSDIQLDDAPLHLVTGTIGGIAQTIVSSPAELIKIRLQVDHNKPNPQNTTFGYTKHLIETRGVAGLYRGLPLSLLRDGPAFGAYFYGYYKIDSLFHQLLDIPHSEPLPGLFTMTAGGIAGLISWGIVIPVDTLKSLQMSTPMDVKPKDNTAWSIFQTNYNKFGIRFLFRGSGPVLLRAFPVNAVTFYVFEASTRMLKSLNVFSSTDEFEE